MAAKVVTMLVAQGVILAVSVAAAQVIDSPDIERPSECLGSLVLHSEDGNRTTITEEVKKLGSRGRGVAVDTVVAEGCGCWSLHSGPRFRGTEVLLQPGRELDTRALGFSRVRSARRLVSCELRAQPVWLVGVVVGGVVVCVFVIALIAIRCYRRRQTLVPKDEAL